MRKLKSMIEKCTQKWVCWCGLFFCVFLMFSSIAEAEEVKYFRSLNCGIFKYDDKCDFWREVDSSDIAKTLDHYKEGKQTKATRFKKSKFYEKLPLDYSIEEDPTVVVEKLEFDCNERIVLHEMNPHDQFRYDHRIYKWSYKKQAYDVRSYDKKGKLVDIESHIYKDNMLVNRSWYDESEKLMEYSTFDHETMIEKIFSPDHKLLDEIGMIMYLD
jgi:hypothetical protein